MLLAIEGLVFFVSALASSALYGISSVQARRNPDGPQGAFCAGMLLYMLAIASGVALALTFLITRVRWDAILK